MVVSRKNNAIGGYFGLELPPIKTCFYDQAYRYVSGRTAFLSILMSHQPKRVWLPHYICDAMISPLKRCHITCLFYEINEDFSVPRNLELLEGDLIIYVNYFGMCAKQQRDVADQFLPSQIIFDHAQAFYAPPLDCLATIYSPRKFFGVPDGGLLVTDLQIPEPPMRDTRSIIRSEHLLGRLAGAPEAGYANYQNAESSLVDLKIYGMSELTERILGSIDYEYVNKMRNRNFTFLHAALGGANRINLDFGYVSGPMSYPFLCTNKRLKEALAKDRIYVPTYWSDVRQRVSKSSYERYLADNVMALPCDQRYDLDDMERIVSIIQKNSY